MPILLALGASLAFGVADFAGGMGARRAPALTIVAAGHVVGLGVAIFVAVIDRSAVPALSELGWGAAAGIAGGLGLAVLYHAIATTRVAVSAPAATLFGALGPIVFGVVIGERPSSIAWAGIVLALPAVALIAMAPSGDDRYGSAARSLVLGIAAGVGFGLFGIFISRTADASGMWPLVAARAASICAVIVAVRITRRSLAIRGRALGMAVTAGALDMAANILFLTAARSGLLALAAIVTSMAPAWTIGLARFGLGERIGRTQAAGIGLAGVALVLIGFG